LSQCERSGQQLDPALVLTFEEQMLKTSETEGGASHLILVTSRAARRLLHECLRIRGHRMITVLAEDEIVDDVTWVEKGQIQLPEESAESVIERLAA